MTDLEMTWLCAEAMGYQWSHAKFQPNVQCWTSTEDNPSVFLYEPLRNDTQMAALIKNFNMEIERSDKGRFRAWIQPTKLCSEWHNDLNRAVVECTAKMQKEKQK